MKSIVLFGGSFNPIHNGHFQMALTASSLKDVEKLLVIPTSFSPHKSNKEMVDAKHRINMCKLAFKENNKIIVSDIEIKRAGKSYTALTINELKSEYQNYRLMLLCGADMLITLKSWYHYYDIISNATILAVLRTGIDEKTFEDRINILKKDNAEIEVLQMEPMNVSSSEIRRRILEDLPLSGLVSNAVLEYIKINNLYKNGD